MQLDSVITGYMGKRMSYRVAIDLLIAVDPEFKDIPEEGQVELIRQDYAPDRIMSYRREAGQLIPHGFIDLPETSPSAARRDFDRLVDAVPQPDWLFRMGGGGGGGPEGLIDPEALAAFIEVVRDVAQRYMEPIVAGVIIQRVSNYMQSRQSSVEQSQEMEIRELRARVHELETRVQDSQESQRTERLTTPPSSAGSQPTDDKDEDTSQTYGH